VAAVIVAVDGRRSVDALAHTANYSRGLIFWREICPLRLEIRSKLLCPDGTVTLYEGMFDVRKGTMENVFTIEHQP
jgi:hypothetical protein